MITGLNHITLAVSELEASLNFYTNLLGFQGEVKWQHGAYLSLDSLWLCLSVDKTAPATDYTHLAFSVDSADFQLLRRRLEQAGVSAWKTNVSEGESYYFLDPDGHKLEIHVGDLATRLQALKHRPYAQMEWLNS